MKLLGCYLIMQVYAAKAVDLAWKAEDAAVLLVKQGWAYTQEHPWTGYSAGAAGLLLAIPATRRMLWRRTFGLLRNQETVLNKSGQRVQLVQAHVEQHRQELQKLQERMMAAEEEYNSGYNKLRAARSAMQRLSTSVDKDERAANGEYRCLLLVASFIRLSRCKILIQTPLAP
jgi:hypothetical protein